MHRKAPVMIIQFSKFRGEVDYKMLQIHPIFTYQTYGEKGGNHSVIKL